MPLCFGTTEYSGISFICRGCRNNKICKEVFPKIERIKRKRKKTRINYWKDL